MTFFSAKRKNEEVLALQIVRKVLGFQIKELKKHARFKQPLHIWYRKQSEMNTTQVTDFWDNIFCAKSKFKQVLCLQVGSCNTSNHSITDDRQSLLNNHRQNGGKYPEDVKTLHSGVPSQLSLANNTNNTKIPRLFDSCFFFFVKFHFVYGN